MKENLFKKAKRIRKKNESWQNAIQRARHSNNNQTGGWGPIETFAPKITQTGGWGGAIQELFVSNVNQTGGWGFLP